MKIIGLCGSSGSGKTTVSEILSRFGVVVLDCDEIYHDLTSRPSECLSELEARFGRDVIQNDALDRRALAKIVFSDPDAYLDLNRISHKHVLNQLKFCLDEERKKDTPLVLIDAPMLFEAGLDAWCDSVLSVICDRNIAIERIAKRDGLNREEIEKRLNHQTNSDELCRRADIIIDNSYDDVNQLTETLKKLVSQWKEKE